MTIRVGFGYDVHQFKEQRKLILGGVEIPFEKGLDGHSDADVVCHAIADAILGAAALGDIGVHFPNTDPAYKNISSLVLLNEVNRILYSEGFVVNNIDVTILIEKPKISDYYNEMKMKIADALKIDSQLVSIKATTGEKMGFIGRSEGAAAYAIVTIREKQNKME